MTDDIHTTTVIRWTLSTPVLASRLREIAAEGTATTDPDQELLCTVADLLNPRRSDLWRDVLTATGALPADADAVWHELGGDTLWMNSIRWDQVRQALLNTKEFTP